jgi:hypothetical protein
MEKWEDIDNRMKDDINFLFRTVVIGLTIIGTVSLLIVLMK